MRGPSLLCPLPSPNNKGILFYFIKNSFSKVQFSTGAQGLSFQHNTHTLPLLQGTPVPLPSLYHRSSSISLNITLPYTFVTNFLICSKLVIFQCRHLEELKDIAIVYLLRWSQDPLSKVHYWFLDAPPPSLCPLSQISNGSDLPLGTHERSWRLKCNLPFIFP